jgi:HD-GYP domain-containing protein (c-di-GMP phosphodiesterase class II)
VCTLRVNIKEIQEGCILSADIFSKTNRPILPKKTVITASLKNVLKAFMIFELEVEKTLVNGIPFLPYETDGVEPNQKMVVRAKLGFTDLFLQAAYQYKKEFHSWQSGLPIDIGKVRALLMPLLEKMENDPYEVFNLHHFSTKEDYMYQHPVAVGVISGFIGKKINLEKGEWLQLAMAGCLADCGMAKVNPIILQKKSSLTSSEYEEVKKHPIFSYKMVQNISVLRKDVKIAILEHHERLDGSGYPLGQKSQKIHQYAKIIALADIFHAMTSERLYRSKQSPFKVLEMILEDSFGKFDMNIIGLISSSIIKFSPGDRVRLSDGREAEILFIDGKHPTRPLVKIIDTEEIIQLVQTRQIHIAGILS